MIVVTGTALRLASSEPIADARPRRLPLPAGPDRTAALARAMMDEAMASARFAPASARLGCTVTSSKLGIDGLVHGMMNGGVTAEAWLSYLAPIPLTRGPVVTSISACATGLFSWIRGAMMLERDDADAVLAGAAEATLNDLVVAGFSRMGVLTTTRPRPFDRARDGFVPAEGAGVVALEREEDAAARGATIRARILGWAMGSSAVDIRGGNTRSEEIVALVMRALRAAELTPRDLAYVHLHGTGTRSNDAAEAAALREIFDRQGLVVPASSTKGMTGHCLGASGAVEAILTMHALAEGVAPPTFGLDEIDDECRSECLIRTPTRLRGRRGMVLSYGFGGSIAALVIEAAPLAAPAHPERSRACRGGVEG